MCLTITSDDLIGEIIMMIDYHLIMILHYHDDDDFTLSDHI